MSIADVLLLLASGTLLFLPGAALMLALLGPSARERWPILLGAAPVVTVGVVFLTTVLTDLLSVRFGLLTFSTVTVLAVLLAAGVRRARGHALWLRKPAPSGGIGGGPFWRMHLATILGLVAMAGASLVSVVTWARGLGSLGTVPQEIDTVTHTLITAYISRTGNAAPGDSWPIDLLTGQPDSFYPQGFHSAAALVAGFGVDPVTAMNAMMLAVFAFAVPSGLFALGSLLDMGGLQRLAGGCAALAAVVAYRPIYALMHDGGILANAVALSLAPGTVAVLVSVLRPASGLHPKRPSDSSLGKTGFWSGLSVSGVAVCALVMVGAFAVHPTSAALVGVGTLAWVLGDLIVVWPGWLALRNWAVMLGLAAVMTAVVTLPVVVNILGSAGTVTDWPRDFGVTPLPQALGVSVGMPYAGFLDPAVAMSQPVLAGVSLFGLGCALVTRRHGGLVLAWGVWLIILMNFLGDIGLPVATTIANLFYNSYVRISGGLAPYQWLLVGVAMVTLGRLLAGLVTRLFAALGRVSIVRGEPVAAALGFLLVLLLGIASVGYVNTNITALSGRYSDADFFRVDADDRAAIDFLARNVEPSERVMNNANDGSTYLYVYEGIAIVETAPLANAQAEYTQQLLLDFGDLDTDPDVQSLIRDLNIHWVYFDTDSPPIGSPVEIFPWWGEPTYSIPPGFEDLEEIDALTKVFERGSVSVYRVTESFFASGR